MSEPLVCSACATPQAVGERFCADCGMPLIHAVVEHGRPNPFTLRLLPKTS